MSKPYSLDHVKLVNKTGHGDILGDFLGGSKRGRQTLLELHNFKSGKRFKDALCMQGENPLRSRE